MSCGSGRKNFFRCARSWTTHASNKKPRIVGAVKVIQYRDDGQTLTKKFLIAIINGKIFCASVELLRVWCC